MSFMSFNDYANALLQQSEIVSRNQNSDIAEFLNRRNIVRILHFSHVDNLDRILEYGLLSRNELLARSLPLTVSDQTRWDELEDGICCSISNPNRLMLQNKVRQMGPNFVVIEISANAILFKKFACFPGNAARNEIKNLAREHPNLFVGVHGLANLYLNWPVRHVYNLGAAQPTDPQSELVFFDEIPLVNLRRIHIPSNASEEVLKSINGIADKYEDLILEVSCEDGFFDSEPNSQYAQRNWQLDWK